MMNSIHLSSIQEFSLSNLHICPEGGLANRLRVLASALALQQLKSCPLVCYWTLRAGELHAPFYDLFQPISNLRITDTPKYLDRLKPVLSRSSWKRALLNALNRRYGIERYLYEDSSHPGAIEMALPAVLPLLDKATSSSVLIRTWQSFGAYQPFLRLFKPIPTLQRRVDALSHSSTLPRIGVHVRRTDHVTATLNSPLDGFFSAVDSALSRQPGSQLFLCSDDSKVRKAFRTRYHSQVLISAAKISRSSTEGIQDAVVDLFTLARCSLIIGSYHSSFSEVAALLGDCPLHTVGFHASFVDI